MLTSFLLMFLALPGTSADVGQDTAKGASLLRGCQAELRLMEGAALSSPDQGDLLSGSYCIGYVNGFVANFELGGGRICPDGQPMGELVRAYVNYMKDHPKLLEDDKRVGLRLALQGAFPCPVSGDSPGAGVRNRRDRL